MTSTRLENSRGKKILGQMTRKKFQIETGLLENSVWFNMNKYFMEEITE
jgi:hypothetical protein